MLDRRAIATYRARLDDLDDEIDQAHTNQDIGTADRAVAEREALLAELSRSVGLCDRPSRLGDDAERARKTVTARINRTQLHLEFFDAALADHLRSTVRTTPAATMNRANTHRMGL